jgi:formylglycine-generating enzyme required for sulfatase activity
MKMLPCLLFASVAVAAVAWGDPAGDVSPAVATSPATQPAKVYDAWPFDANEAARRQDETAKALGAAAELKLDLDANVTMTLALLPAGKFLMGSPKGEKGRGDNEDQHEVTISKPFYMGTTEVTQEQYERVMGNNPSQTKGPRNPVDSVSLDDAREFCRKLSQKTGRTIALPTEAQWEYACRAGSAARFYFGDDPNFAGLGEYAWHSDNSQTCSPVGRKKPNAFGLYDMHGNVWEWCSNRYQKDYGGPAEQPEAQGQDSQGYRVVRGGAWSYGLAGCRCAFRGYTLADRKGNSTGFRVIAIEPGGGK